MRILRAGNYRRMRWKNGGGETAEIAVSPEGADLDAFDWRVSMATVETSGPFSAFPGVDRTLSILDGDGMVLDIRGRRPVTLTGASAPCSFPADAATDARLVGGPVTDLNVMTRRSAYRHKVSLLDANGSTEILPGAAETLLFCLAGSLDLSGAGRRERLGRFDAAVLRKQVPFGMEGRGRFFLIELEPAWPRA